MYIFSCSMPPHLPPYLYYIQLYSKNDNRPLNWLYDLRVANTIILQVYQIYAKRSPQEVHKILRQHGTDYIILENSICLSQGDQGCRLIDILDLDNGHVIDGGQLEEGLQHTRVPRFCKAIKRDVKSFSPYFKKVFENRTFYLYKLL